MMSRTVTLELPEAVISWMETSARERGMSPSDWIVCTLIEHARLQSHTGSSQLSSPSTSQGAMPCLAGNHEPDEKEAIRKRFRGHFGKLNSGNTHSANNEEIDADLARAYSEPPRDDM
jgi:hypothetical protein